MPQSRKGRMRSRRVRKDRKALSERARQTNNSGAGVLTSLQEGTTGRGGFFVWVASHLPGGNNQPVIQEEDGKLATLRERLTTAQKALDDFPETSNDIAAFEELKRRRDEIQARIDEITGAPAQP